MALFAKALRYIAIAACALVAFAVPGARAADDTHDMHVIIPLTGGGAFLGKAEQDAIKVAAGVINKEGGIHGKKLNVIFHDDQSSPQVAVQLMSQVIATRPAVILGSTISQLCNAQAPLVKEAACAPQRAHSRGSRRPPPGHTCSPGRGTRAPHRVPSRTPRRGGEGGARLRARPRRRHRRRRPAHRPAARPATASGSPPPR